ncbi:hypothetical protein [Paraglaciecola sp. L3A3]|uniref:hypothetical protein n=1 Tax=Paraglaciecola sp. L3A3 TaxID=2686358 RepID=UPI0018EF1595|nr:hypothetical protein [Paraglaciecola sp. L3A3]
MDIDQKQLKSLLRKTDRTFEEYKLHPSSDSYAEAYEQAKNELDHYLAEVRKSISHRSF